MCCFKNYKIKESIKKIKNKKIFSGVKKWFEHGEWKLIWISLNL